MLGPDKRDDLIDDVLRGRRSPEEAEREAERLGIGPIARRPDQDDFKPLTEQWWSLLMAVAWIAWRTLEAVCDSWDDYRRECWHWSPLRWRSGPEGVVYDGHELKERPRASPILLEMAARSEVPLRYSETNVDRAKADLWRALSEGLLEATALDRKSSLRVLIPAHEWAGLDWETETTGPAYRICAKGAPIGQGYQQVALRSAELLALWPPTGPTLTVLPETAVPGTSGHMALYRAAQWIATKGGGKGFEPSDLGVWRDAYGELLSLISSGELTVTGIHEGERRALNPNLFVAIAVDYPHVEPPKGLRFTDELYLRSYPYVGDEQWRAGFDDSLCDRRGPRWKKLMVGQADVARLWPFDITTAVETTPPYRTGLRGRPTSWSFIEAEFLRRREAGIAHRNLRAEAEVLASWVREAHPAAPQATVKTIKEKLRSGHAASFDLTGK